ncbi:MAG: hypothetical protein ACHQF0_13985 [Chitinophagales bacterium]
MVRMILFSLIFFISPGSYAQEVSSKRINLGIEQDLLPYITGGYFAGVWAGKDHLRFRAITASVHKPDFIIETGFTNNKVTAYALLADYFLKENWKGWWAGTGLVDWQSSIQTNKKESTSNYKTWLLNGSIGYSFKLCKNFYISPWCALHVRVGGDKHITVDDKIFDPPLLNPEASVKLGAYF